MADPDGVDPDDDAQDPPGLVEVILEDARWQAAGLPALAERAARAALRAADLDPDGHEISLLGCDDSRIALLNADFRGKPSPTNVLSWPASDDPDDPFPTGGPDEPVFLGDLAISYDTCAREAGAGGLALADHVTHLVVHGVLHLLGYDHEMEAEADAMEEFETKILASMGVANPYSQQERHLGA